MQGVLSYLAFVIIYIISIHMNSISSFVIPFNPFHIPITSTISIHPTRFLPILYSPTNNLSTTILFFKKGSGGDNNDNNNSNNNNKSKRKGLFGGLLKFLSGVTQAKLSKEYSVPLPSTGDRYHLRLLRSEYGEDIGTKRHATTRIIRFLPDVTFETAQEIVKKAFTEGKALVRIFQSKKEAEYVATMFRLAEPPLNVEIYDSKKDEVLPL